MPPRTRNAGRGRILALGIPVNTTGLPSVPGEILDEIVSHLSDVPIPLFEAHVLSCTYLEHTETLRALSETCRRLRNVFLVRAWQRLEVCASRRVSDGYEYRGRRYQQNSSSLWSNELAKDFAQELVRQMEIVTVRSPALASEVRIVTVILSEYCATTVFPEFFRCLSLLPNLHTIQIVKAPKIFASRFGYNRKSPEPLGHALSGYTFPSVRTLALHETALNMLKCCPNLDSLTLNHSMTHPPLSRIAKNALKLRALTSAPLAASSVKGSVVIQYVLMF
ncbi:hypothetical protein B0H13DRAFT_1618778 [Mycena leptocephala]|nr:hypothetical protein B0H13DRAFT_1618778 [Mycena leptocephala]